MEKDKTTIVIARNLKKLREDSGLSQEKLATLAGLHRTYISMIERSEKNITVVCLEKIAKALNVELKDFLDETI